MKKTSKYKKVIDELAFKIMYEVADNHKLSKKEFSLFNERINEEIEVSVDSISSIFKKPKDVIDIDVANAMGEINHEDIIALKREREVSVVH